MLLADGIRRDPARGVRILKDRELRLEAAVRVRENASKPRFVACEGWMHPFSDEAAEVEIRWAFDRRTWKLAAAQVEAPDGRIWRECTPEEMRDLEESLVLGNSEILVDPSDWEECFESERSPNWMSDGSGQERAFLTGSAARGEAG
ncbi:hypothetical protein [Antarcticirhabdus aurantiaca]|uniref:Uncharacterized protein n=1 Tax=Antarcticirhabdus aurantiaca TaxID=2606717 RepID=A0ACD4NRS8_9HYPH|nr:hypothetical protein [Antarcticirhabdus aurantiaca]WAJ29521.1 hypothetical protein OXU80_04605 [Jeongeuplla avenae]